MGRGPVLSVKKPKEFRIDERALLGQLIQRLLPYAVWTSDVQCRIDTCRTLTLTSLT